MHNLKSKKAMVLVLANALLLISPLALAERGVAKPTAISGAVEVQGREHQTLFSQLNLNPGQSKKIQAIMQAGRQKSQVIKEQLHTKRHAMMQYLQTPSATQAQALNMNAEINDLQRQLGELRLKSLFAMRAQLTPEQLQKFQHLKRNHADKSDGRGCERPDAPGRHGAESF